MLVGRTIFEHFGSIENILLAALIPICNMLQLLQCELYVSFPKFVYDDFVVFSKDILHGYTYTWWAPW